MLGGIGIGGRRSRGRQDEMAGWHHRLDGREFEQECWSGLPCPPPGDLPDLRLEPASLTSPALAVGFFTTSATWEAPTTPLPMHQSLPAHTGSK